MEAARCRVVRLTTKGTFSRKPPEFFRFVALIGFAGVVAGLGIGWVSRPKVGWLGKLPFETYMQMFNSSARDVAYYTTPITENIIMWAVIGLIAGIGLGWVVASKKFPVETELDT